MNIEEIDTVYLNDTREAMVKKLKEIDELLVSIQLKISQLDVVGNDIWSSLASRSVYERFSEDYQHYQQLYERFLSLVLFLDSVGSQYEQLDKSIKEQLSKIESVSL